MMMNISHYIDIWDSPVDAAARPTSCTEEEDGFHVRGATMSPIKETADSADEDDQGTRFVLHEGETPALAKSYAKLAKTQFVHGFTQDEESECKEWFQTQNEWLSNVGKNSEYFDDYL